MTMTPSDSARQRFNQFQSKVDSSPLPSQQNSGNVPRVPVESSGQPSNSNIMPTNFSGFLQRINFSIPPPPLPPPMLLTPVPSAQPYYSSDFNLPISSPVRGILTNWHDPNENNFILEQCNKQESFSTEEILFNSKKTDEKPQIQLYKFSDQLKHFHTSLVKLKTDLENVNLISNELDLASWSESIASLSSQRNTLKKLKQTIKIDSKSLSLLKYKMKKRLKKRLTRKKKNLVETKLMSKYEVAYSHMQKLQQIVDKQKQEEKFKIEADSILFSVRQKKSEANCQIQFLTALSKLHTARINATNAQNKPSLYEAVCGFHKIIDKLKSMWQRQMEEYLIEENGLKIILKDLAVTAEDQDCTNMKETFGQWLKLLFGTTNLQKESYFSNYNDFIEIRRDWDKYVVDEEINSSKIPAGWITPKYPRDDAWSRLVL